jgi:hypothetical protein
MEQRFHPVQPSCLNQHPMQEHSFMNPYLCVAPDVKLGQKIVAENPARRLRHIEQTVEVLK